MRNWQGATVGTFAQLYFGADTPETRRRLIDGHLLDDGTIDRSGAVAATLIDAGPGGGGFTGASYGFGYGYDYAGVSALAAGSEVDNLWFQTSGTVGQTVFELPFAAVKAAIFPTIDHGPLPDEAIESTAYLSNDRVTWTQAVVQKVWLEGWNPDLRVVWDGFVYAVGSGTNDTFRYVSVVHGGPGALEDDGDNEINASWA